MKKFLISVLFFLSVCAVTFAQVDSIKSHSGQNHPPKSNSVEGKTDGDGGCLSDACGLACSDGCGWMIQNAVIGAFKLHSNYLKKRKEIPEVVSLELMPHIGYATPSSTLALPRFRGNWGLFSTDFRFSNMTEYGTKDGTDFYNTIDWQVLEFNFVITKPVIVRLGIGLMHEFYSSSTFMENFLGVDVNFADHQYLATGEARIAPDYATSAIPRIETNFRFNYRINKTPHMNAYAMAGLVYQNYYRNSSTSFKGVEVWVAQVGMAFNFH
jgi:hypothetical protein